MSAGVVAEVSTQRVRRAAVVDPFVEEVQPGLDPADPVGDLGEVAPSQLLLPLHAERAVVGGDADQLVRAQALPQFLVMVSGLVRMGGEHTYSAPSSPGWG